jgi:integrase
MFAVDLRQVCRALKLICPGADWSWLASTGNRISADNPGQARKYHLVTSDRLYALGIELMDDAVAHTSADNRRGKMYALQYRDGLAVAFLALLPLRRHTLVAIRIGEQLTKHGDLWALDIPARETKTQRALELPISTELGTRIDLYLEHYRPRINGANSHNALWASSKQGPLSGIATYYAVRRRTKRAFGFAVNLHRFRHAAASFWSIRDPINVRGVKDLLGQRSFGITNKYYIMGQSRLASRALARAVDAARK